METVPPKDTQRVSHGIRREKARLRVAEIEEKIANRRKDHIEKESLRLVSTYELIGVEDLNIQGISRSLRNAKNVVDTSWNTFTQKLVWKARGKNCLVVKVDRFFPSSKLCSNCGYRYQGLGRSEREWECPKCGSLHDRDHNAAKNLRNESVRLAKSELRLVEDGNPDTNTLRCGIGHPMKRETEQLSPQVALGV